MIKIDLHTKKNDKSLFKLNSIERNPNNNKFLILGTNYFKIFDLLEDNIIKEEKLNIQRRIKTIKSATWSRKLENFLYYYDTNNYLHSLDLNSQDKSELIYKFDYEVPNLSVNCNDSIIALWSEDNKIDLLDLNRKNILSSISRDDKIIIRDCQFSPSNPNYIIFSSDRGNIYLYDITNTSSQIKDFYSEPKDILSISWHPFKQNIFCSGGMDNYIRVWDYNHSRKNLADIKTSGECSKVSFLKSNPNYIISSFKNNYNINIFNVKLRDIPEYEFTGNESNIIGFFVDFEGTRIVSADRKGTLIINYLNKGERILDDITTNVIKFNNNNELYCFHVDKLRKNIFPKNIHKDSKNDKDEGLYNDNLENAPLYKMFDNLNNIYLLNFNHKEMQLMNKSSTKEGIKLFLKKDITLQLNNELRQYYIFTPEQIHSLFRGYIYYIEKNENLYKRNRFQSWNDIYKVNMPEEPTNVDNFDYARKLVISINKNLSFAKNHINNYNHISIWNTLLNLSQQKTFKLLFNQSMGREEITINLKKKKKKYNINNLNKSFEKEKKNNEVKDPISLKLMTTILINQLSKIIDYLIDDYGDIYLATIICYLFKPILFKDEILKKRILRLIKDCVNNLRKYQLYVDANHLIKYGPEENNKIDKKTYIFKYSCTKCKIYEFKDGTCSCGKVIACEECEKKISGLFLWCPLCGHEEHLSHINKNKAEFYCNGCKKKKIIEN